MYKQLYLYFILSLLLPFTELRAEDVYMPNSVGVAQGLSNSAVLSIYQDDDGLMWFGTYDGLNSYDGKSINVYRADDTAGQHLLNNVIYQVNGAGSNQLWVSTSTGVNKISVREQKVLQTFEIFPNDFRLYSNRKGDTWVVNMNKVYRYDIGSEQFVLALSADSMYDLDLPFVDESGALYLFAPHGNEVYVCRNKCLDARKMSVEVDTMSVHDRGLRNAFYQNELLCFVDELCDLYVYDLRRQSKMYVRNIKSLIDAYGTVRGIVSFDNDFLIGFIQNGLVRLSGADRYAASFVDSRIRLFDVYKDPRQNIVWVGTDGAGVVAYSKKQPLGFHLMYNDFQRKLARQVRSIFVDEQQNLWFGTKGDGLVCVKDFSPEQGYESLLKRTYIYFPNESRRSLSTYKRGTSEYQVFGINKGRRKGMLWLSSSDSPGLSYYDAAQDRVLAVNGAEALTKVHAVFEQNDSLLWAVTAGKGLFKIHYEWDKRSGVSVKELRQRIFRNGAQEISDFFPMLEEGDSLLWLGSRGNGLVRYNYKTDQYRVYELGDEAHKSQNDILCLHRKGKGLYVGTVSGLVYVELEGDVVRVSSVGHKDGFLNDMIHGILEDKRGLLWLSTNKGLIKYNTENGSFHTYYYSNGLEIGEFSDDAYFKNTATGNLWFGGVDGLVCVDADGWVEGEEMSAVRFSHLRVGNRAENFYAHYRAESNTLCLDEGSRSFAIDFVMLDYMNHDEYEYSYRLLGSDDERWTPYSKENVARFHGLDWGNYVLEVRCKKDVFDSNLECYQLNVALVAPWYLSHMAWLCYAVVLLLVGAYVYVLLRRYYKREKMVRELMRQESSNADRKSLSFAIREVMAAFSEVDKWCGEVYAEEDLTAEGRARLLRAHEKLIDMAFRWEGEMGELEGWREMGEVVRVVERKVDVKSLLDEVVRMLLGRGYADAAYVEIDWKVEEDVALPKVPLMYLFYFIYAHLLENGGHGSLEIEADAEALKVSVRVPDALVVDYMHLEGLRQGEKWDMKKWWYVYALKKMAGKVYCADRKVEIVLPYAQWHVAEEEGERKEVLLLEDREDLGQLMKEVLAGGYRVRWVSTVQEAFQVLKREMPDVFVADTMIYWREERMFLDYLRANRGLLLRTVFVPLLTWESASVLSEELRSMMDGMVVLPADMLYFREKVDTAVNGGASKAAVVLGDPDEMGEWTCENEEQVMFVKRLLGVLEEYVDDEDLSASFIAEKMNMSKRQYYRKFKEVCSMSSAEYIKTYRLNKAAALLVSTDDTVQKIIGEVGFQSSSYFYKEFANCFGMTPKKYKEMEMEKEK